MNSKGIVKLLPGYNCGSCGYNTCNAFSEELIKQTEIIDKCPLLSQVRYTDSKEKLFTLLNNSEIQKSNKIIGVLDNYEADIILSPLDGEHSCREILLTMSTINVEMGDIIEYRPIGCPIVHFAKVLKKEHILITVHIVGPSVKNTIDESMIKKIGNCMVLGFEGNYSGKRIQVGETIRFLPKHCMMQKVHSGVVVKLTNNSVVLEGIDLKVWHLPIIANQNS